jgi:NAD(P)-dependent dehydrogenase (short-subunit alcohol dehydrogenase family)
MCLITGATAGIGWSTARALAALAAHVILHGRNPEKLNHRSVQLRDEYPQAKIESIQADFEDLEQVQMLVNTLERQGVSLDVLINNAGAYFNRRHMTSLGVEKTFLVNHLAPFFLTNKLLTQERFTQTARIIVVTSDTHTMGSINFSDLAFRRGYFGMCAYARSKLANLLFAYELARRLESTDITVNAVHPGHVASDIWKTNFGVFGPTLKWFISLFARTPEQGAETLIYLASSDEVAGISGRYFVDRQMVDSSPGSYDIEVAQALWRVSEELIVQV